MASRLLIYFAATARLLYGWDRSGPRLLQRFSADDAGLQRFRDFIKSRNQPLVQIVADLEGEDFHEDQIPYLHGAERRAVVERRLAQRYRGARIAAALSLGHTADERRNERMLLASFSDAQPLIDWLDTLEQASARVVGVYSTALLAPALAARLGAKNESLFVMTANHAGLRQSFVERGRLRFSRLERIHDDGAGLNSARVRTETERMLKYLGTLRALPSGAAMRVLLVVADAERAHFQKTLGSSAGLAFTTLGVTETARRIELRRLPERAGAEVLFLHLAARRPPSDQFLRGESRRKFLVWKLRRSLIGAGVAGFATCGAYAATLWLDQLAVREQIEGIRLNVEVARDQLARLNARLPATPAPIETLKASTLELRRIAAGTVAPEAALEHVSHALDQSPRIELDALAWSAEPEQAIEISGRVSGIERADHRTIAEEIQRFAMLLGADPGWRVIATRLPFDLSSESLLSMDAGADAPDMPRFSIRIARSPG